MSATSSVTPDVTTGRIVRIWWPLAASWLLMGVEGPAIVAAVSRLESAEPNLAAFGGIVYPVSLIIEGPIIMLLAASTALSRDTQSYRALHRFMVAAAIGLTVIHVAIAFTPLYDVIARDWLNAPEAAIEPGRTGLMIMTPWTGTIAYRRFQQGVLIRYEQSRKVVVGTALRLVVNGTILVCGVAIATVDGMVLGTTAIAVGVTTEAVYAGVCVRPILRERLPSHDPTTTTLTARRFLRFYIPLAITPLLTLALQPIGAAAMNRMPDAIPSVASWTAVYGMIFLLRALGFAYQEVTVKVLDEPGGDAALRRFAVWLSVIAFAALALVWLTPLADLWFRVISGLPADLAAVSTTAIGFGILMPGYAVWIHYYQGVLVQSHQTRGITEAVVLYLVVCVLGLSIGVAAARWRGIETALVCFTIAGLCQTAWLALRSRRT